MYHSRVYKPTMCKQLERSGLVALCLSFQTNLSKFPVVHLYIFYFMEFLRNKNKYSKSPSIKIGIYSLKIELWILNYLWILRIVSHISTVWLLNIFPKLAFIIKENRNSGNYVNKLNKNELVPIKSYNLRCTVVLVDIYGSCWLLHPSVLTRSWHIVDTW